VLDRKLCQAFIGLSSADGGIDIFPPSTWSGDTYGKWFRMWVGKSLTIQLLTLPNILAKKGVSSKSIRNLKCSKDVF